MEDNQHQQLEEEEISLDDVKQIFEELKAWRKTKLFAYIVENNRAAMVANFDTILEYSPQNATMLREREALLGETRFRRSLIKEISGDIEDMCNARLTFDPEKEQPEPPQL